MDSSRETKEYTTKSGAHKFVAKTYITAREERDIQEPMFKSMEVKAKMSGEQEMSSFKGSLLHEIQDKRITAVLVSLDDSIEDILKRVLDLPLPEYEEIYAVIAEVSGEKKAKDSLEQKKNTQPAVS